MMALLLRRATDMNDVLSAPHRIPLLLILLLAPGVGLAAPESAHPPLARHSALSEPRLASSARARLQPVLAFSSRGTLVGLGGTF
ncbi:hypothetical protein [Archangium violaceum]|uniref:hypothetical protein n=1 Tax=Archangium violaceum TaxID=83451 RepID=UPI0036D8D594